MKQARERRSPENKKWETKIYPNVSKIQNTKRPPALPGPSAAQARPKPGAARSRAGPCAASGLGRAWTGPGRLPLGISYRSCISWTCLGYIYILYIYMCTKKKKYIYTHIYMFAYYLVYIWYMICIYFVFWKYQKRLLQKLPFESRRNHTKTATRCRSILTNYKTLLGPWQKCHQDTSLRARHKGPGPGGPRKTQIEKYSIILIKYTEKNKNKKQISR